MSLMNSDQASRQMLSIAPFLQRKRPHGYQQDDHVLRNREYQRRSRARRKDYISELESRIRKYEDEGVKIAVDVQTAARRVAEENRVLRALLETHGIATAVVDAHLARTKQTLADLPLPSTQTTPPHNIHYMRGRSDGLIAPTAFNPFLRLVGSNGKKRSSAGLNDPPKATTTLEAARLSTELDLTPAAQAHQSASHAHHSSDSLAIQAHSLNPNLPGPDRNPPSNNELPQQELSYASSPNSHSDAMDDDVKMLSDNGSPTRRKNLAGGGLATPPLSGHGSGTCCSTTGTSIKAPPDETDCEQAARVIASMRGHEDPESLWPELGCSRDRKCMVKNVRIFQMAA